MSFCNTSSGISITTSWFSWTQQYRPTFPELSAEAVAKDVTPPMLVDLQFLGTSVSVETGEVLLTVQVDAWDDLSGVEYFHITFDLDGHHHGLEFYEHEFGKPVQKALYASGAHEVGEGTLTLDGLTLMDQAGNYIVLGWHHPWVPPMPGDPQDWVWSVPGWADTTEPVLSNFEVTSIEYYPLWDGKSFNYSYAISHEAEGYDHFNVTLQEGNQYECDFDPVIPGGDDPILYGEDFRYVRNYADLTEIVLTDVVLSDHYSNWSHYGADDGDVAFADAGINTVWRLEDRPVNLNPLLPGLARVGFDELHTFQSGSRYAFDLRLSAARDLNSYTSGTFEFLDASGAALPFPGSAVVDDQVTVQGDLLHYDLVFGLQSDFEPVQIAIGDMYDGDAYTRTVFLLAEGEAPDLSSYGFDAVRYVSDLGPEYPRDIQIGTAADEVFLVDNRQDEVHGGDGYDRVLIIESYGGLSGSDWSGIERLDGSDEQDNVDGSEFSTSLELRGHAGRDRLSGGHANDLIFGGDDDDKLFGLGSTDRLFGGAGADEMDGGEESDHYFVDEDDTVTDSGTIGYDKAQITDAAGQILILDDWSGVERINGYTGHDAIIATTQTEAVLLYGGDGDDWLQGGMGDDVLLGGAGNDVLLALTGDNIMNGGVGQDRYYGGDQNDVFFIDDLGDVIVDGGDGYDRAKIAKDLGGTLTLDLWSTVERVIGHAGADAIDARGASEAFTLVGNAGRDRLIGSAHDDKLFGGQGDDNLRGAGGDDALVGADGDDRLQGGAGDDFYLGGAGADRFQWSDGFGRDVVKDFDSGQDRLDFTAHVAVDGMADLSIQQLGAHTVIALAAGGADQITLVDIVATTLSASDFDFA